MTRAEKVAKAQELRGGGLKLREIAEAMGAPISTVGQWLDDPDGARSRARKRRYDLTCRICRGRVNGTSPGKMRDREHPVCATCAPAYYAKWNRETVAAAIQRFAERYGEPPSAWDFNVSLARATGHPEVAERFYRDGDYPHYSSIQYVFGSWNAAIAAAGFEPRGVGKRGPQRQRVAA